jgi:uncharacterized protein YdeI (YjbR/CyaY-like superfamily)
MHAGRNVVIVGAFRGDFRLSFFNAALMKDSEGVLEKPGLNSRSADMIRFTASSRVAELEPVIVSYLKEAITQTPASRRRRPKLKSNCLTSWSRLSMPIRSCRKPSPA